MTDMAPDLTINRLDNGGVCIDLTGLDGHRVTIQRSQDTVTWCSMRFYKDRAMVGPGDRVLVINSDAWSWWYRLMLVDSAGRPSYSPMKRWGVAPVEPSEHASAVPEWRYEGAIALVEALSEAVDRAGEEGHRPCLRDCLGDLASAMRSDRDAVTDRVVETICSWSVA